MSLPSHASLPRRISRGLAALSLSAAATTALVAQPIQVPARFQPPTSWADLAEAVDPAVVSVQATSVEKREPREKDGQPSEPQPRQIDPFEFFFGTPGKPAGEAQPDGSEPVEPPEEPRPPAEPGERRADTGGSGFLVSGDGLVVTNNHVVEGATEVRVHLGDRDYPARIRGVDSETDLALLAIDVGRELPYLELGDSDAVRVGDWVMVIGNPLNLDKTVTTGVVSAKGRTIGITDVSFENFIQTDAAINFGNSGGPLVDVHGRVVGIATAINFGAENIGFAVPVNTLRDVLPQLRDRGKVTRGYLGIDLRNLDFARAQALGLASTEGALVAKVRQGTPALAAGVEQGDVVVAVDGRKVARTRDLIQYVASKPPGTTIALEILRHGQAIQRPVTLERPAPPAPTP